MANVSKQVTLITVPHSSSAVDTACRSYHSIQCRQYMDTISEYQQYLAKPLSRNHAGKSSLKYSKGR